MGVERVTYSLSSRFQRLRSEDLSEWLEDYSLGEIWERDLLNMGHINYR